MQPIHSHWPTLGPFLGPGTISPGRAPRCTGNPPGWRGLSEDSTESRVTDWEVLWIDVGGEG